MPTASADPDGRDLAQRVAFQRAAKGRHEERRRAVKRIWRSIRQSKVCETQGASAATLVRCHVGELELDAWASVAGLGRPSPEE